MKKMDYPSEAVLPRKTPRRKSLDYAATPCSSSPRVGPNLDLAMRQPRAPGEGDCTNPESDHAQNASSTDQGAQVEGHPLIHDFLVRPVEQAARTPAHSGCWVQISSQNGMSLGFDASLWRTPESLCRQ
jgi:hypothetical protein